MENKNQPERRILKSERHVFWEALIIAVFVFSLGIMLGVFLENLRKGQIEELYSESELQLLDLRIQSELFSLKDFSCENAVKENMEFGDKIFGEAILLQQLEESQTLTESLKMQHKKYDLLRTLFWINSLKIKEKCKNSFHTVVYIYQYEPDIDTRAKQTAFSKSLSELKDKLKDRIVLIPIAGNMNLTSTESLMKEYKAEKLPVVIVDEKYRFYEITELQKIEPLAS